MSEVYERSRTDSERLESVHAHLEMLREAYDEERQRRIRVERKYVGLKRKYEQLERSFRLLRQSIADASNQEGRNMEPPPRPLRSSPEAATRPRHHTLDVPPIDTPREETASVIDLTSPLSSRHTPSPHRLPQRSSETPARPTHMPRERLSFSTPSLNRHLHRETIARAPTDFSAPASSLEREPSAASDTTPALPPAPSMHVSRYFSREREETSTSIQRARRNWLDLDRASSSPVVPSPPRVASDSEDASLELARRLQHEENLAAFEDWHRRRVAATDMEADNNNNGAFAYREPDARAFVDPDNMTYDQLLQLGEELGDVKKERWKEMAVQVISSLPMHRWRRTGTGSDINCIVCQYDFQEGEQVLTLPCAHVFHDDCVGGWIRENNSCPLCKLEIAQM